jgi:hypothetical protein
MVLAAATDWASSALEECIVVGGAPSIRLCPDFNELSALRYVF